MIFGSDRSALRRKYRDAWRKRTRGDVLTALESQIATVVEQHPEYHDVVLSEQIDEDYSPERGATNPFLHMGMHLAIREQVGTNRPPGIAAIFNTLAASLQDPLEAEHRMMEALGETLWEAQRDGTAPDENAYLERLRRLAASRGSSDSM